jgi:hypothetical protein
MASRRGDKGTPECKQSEAPSDCSETLLDASRTNHPVINQATTDAESGPEVVGSADQGGFTRNISFLTPEGAPDEGALQPENFLEGEPDTPETPVTAEEREAQIHLWSHMDTLMNTIISHAPSGKAEEQNDFGKLFPNDQKTVSSLQLAGVKEIKRTELISGDQKLGDHIVLTFQKASIAEYAPYHLKHDAEVAFDYAVEGTQGVMTNVSGLKAGRKLGWYHDADIHSVRISHFGKDNTLFVGTGTWLNITRTKTLAISPDGKIALTKEGQDPADALNATEAEKH